MRVKFIIIIMLQVVLLTGMIGYKQYWVVTGEKILLRTVPVDPRDIFRGDYVRLNYEITNLDLENFSLHESFKPNDKIYVILGKDADGTFKASAIAKTRPSSGTFIQGSVRNEMQVSKWEISVKDDSDNIHVLRPRWFGFKPADRIIFCLDRQDNVINQFRESAGLKPQCPANSAMLAGTIEEIKETKSRQLTVEYGIESYFVEEGKGRAIENARNASSLKVEVSLAGDGKGIITALVMDGTILK